MSGCTKEKFWRAFWYFFAVAGPVIVLACAVVGNIVGWNKQPDADNRVFIAAAIVGLLMTAAVAWRAVHTQRKKGSTAKQHQDEIDALNRAHKKTVGQLNGEIEQVRAEVEAKKLFIEVDDMIQAALGNILSRCKKADGHSIGLHVYRVASDKDGEFQDRYLRLRLSKVPNRSGTRWGPGKGVVGECWGRTEPPKDPPDPPRDRWWSRTQTWEDLEDCRPQEWSHQKPHITKNLTHGEWMKFQRYTTIIAIPIVARNENGTREEYLGCVSLDVYDDPTTSMSLWNEQKETRKILHGVADELGKQFARLPPLRFS